MSDDPTPSPAPGDTQPSHRAGLPEGPEAPPRGVRAMAVVRWLLLLAVTALAATTTWKFWGPGARAHADHREALYYCPMHPEIRSPDPGVCPICYMNLEPIPADRRRATGPMSAALDGGAAVALRDGGTVTGGQPATTGDDGGAALPAVVPVTLTLDRQQLAGVSTALVERRPLREGLRVPGVVEASENAVSQVHVRAAGFLERVDVRATSTAVARGQTLAWLYSPQIYQAQLELLVAHRGAAAQAPSDPAMQGAGLPADTESAARRSLELYGMTAADIETVLRQGVPMRAVPVRAPAGGYVTRLAAALGQYATPEMTLYELTDLSRVWVVASLFEHDLARVRRGGAAQFVTPGAQAQPIAARVELIEPSVSNVTRTARVRLTVANPQMRLRPGQYGDVLFALPASDALVVPRDAVINTGRHQYAFVASGEGRFEPRPVRTGALVEEGLQVLEGLREGERVVVRGAFMIDAESRLQASFTTAPAAVQGDR
ncbi:MAG: efflux RND transporter periplasmic adaptor subunit [Deltaproteobacteria bacterium]|nr:efflux RND transporter periplasmic adaptor subunit [Deltaproteobacteria bacterium]